MKAKFFIPVGIVLAAAVTLGGIGWAAGAPKNPVHDRRKAWHDKNKEVYKGQTIIDEKEKKDKEKIAEDQNSEKVTKEEKLRLAQLMKEFDRDKDGVISDGEMAKAEKSGKGKELKSLLEKAKAQREARDKQLESAEKEGSETPKSELNENKQ